MINNCERKKPNEKCTAEEILMLLKGGDPDYRIKNLRVIRITEDTDVVVIKKVILDKLPESMD